MNKTQSILAIIVTIVSILLFCAKAAHAQSTGPCKHCPSTSLTSGANTLRPEVNDLPNPQCTAIKKDGTQCTRQALDNDTKCWQHSDKTPRCNAPTKSGGKCKMTVPKDGDKCYHHDPDRQDKTKTTTMTKAT